MLGVPKQHRYQIDSTEASPHQQDFRVWFEELLFNRVAEVVAVEDFSIVELLTLKFRNHWNCEMPIRDNNIVKELCGFFFPFMVGACSYFPFALCIRRQSFDI